MSHSELREKALKRKDLKAAYNALEIEFSLLRELLKARRNAGLTQSEIANRMGAKARAVTRLETSLTTGKHSLSIATLKEYAEALACHLEIKVVADNQPGAS